MEAFNSVKVQALLTALVFAFTLESEHTVLHRYLDILLFYAWNLGLDEEGAIGFADIYARAPIHLAKELAVMPRR
jgi:hypothetical protein